MARMVRVAGAQTGPIQRADTRARALKMPYEAVMDTLTTWRQMGGSKLTILGGEPTLHPDYIPIIRNGSDAFTAISSARTSPMARASPAPFHQHDKGGTPDDVRH